MASNLDIYSQLVKETDRLSPIASAISSLKFTPQTAGQEGTALGVGLGQALLAGILAGKSKARNREQNQGITQALLSRATTGSLGDLSALDPTIASYLQKDAAMDVIEATAKAKALQNELDLKYKMETPEGRQEAARRLGLFDDVETPEMSAIAARKDLPEAEAMPEAEPMLDESAPPPIENEQSDLQKAMALYKSSKGAVSLDEALDQVRTETSRSIQREGDVFNRQSSLRKEFTGREPASKYQYMALNLPAFIEAYNDPHPVSDYELVRKAAQAVEPGLAVRRDDEQSIQAAASALGQTYQQIKAWLTDESSMTPSQRAGLARTVQRNYNSAAKAYEQERGLYKELAQRENLDPDRAVPFGPAVMFEDLYPDLNISYEKFAGGGKQELSLDSILSAPDRKAALQQLSPAAKEQLRERLLQEKARKEGKPYGGSY